MAQASSPSQPWTEWLLASGLVVLVSALAFLPLVGQLGFYHDDWFTTISRIGGVNLADMHSIDRPGMGLLYHYTNRLVGEAPLAWHLYAWLARVLGGLALLWLLRQVWPSQPRATTLMVVLYAVYPGFLQQPSANNYQNHILAYSASILSLALTVWALRSSRRWLQVTASLAALALAYFYPRVYEAMIGMEALRFLLIWLLLRRRQTSFWTTAWRAGLWFAPYLLLAAWFVYWRLFVFISTRVSIDAGALLDQYRSDPFGMAGRMVLTVIQDGFETLFSAWLVPLYQLGLNARPGIYILGFLAAAAAVLLLLGYHRWAGRLPPQAGQPPDWTREAVALGLLGLLLTLLPVALSDREVQFRIYLDRYTYQSIVPAVILLGGLIFAAVKPGWQAGFFSALVTLAVLTHILNAAVYADNWAMQRKLWWQLSWRAPQLAPGTLLVVNMPQGYRYPESAEVWGPANRIYYPQGGGPRITAQLLNNETLAEILAGKPVERDYRLIQFDLEYDKSLLLSVPSTQSCLHVIDSRAPEFSAADDALVRQVAPVSRLEQIDPYAPGVSPPRVIFGPEPDRDWCYYYQRAGLARQRADWPEVIRLGQQAAQAGLGPQDAVEWMPFIEADLRTGGMELARQRAAMITNQGGYAAVLCQNYQRLADPAGQELFCEP